MHVTITGVPRGSGNNTATKIDQLVVPFVQALRSAYIEANISDDESATVDLLADILVYAARVENADVTELADDAARSARGELYDAKRGIEERLEELRVELRAERMSYGELAELQSLAKHIEPGDVELLEAAGVPEEEA